MLLPTNTETLLALLQQRKIELLSIKATREKDKYEILVKVKP
jgi:hypothetical protein